MHPDTLIGCEDLHVYKPHTGEVEIFAGCAEKLEDQLVFPFSFSGLLGGVLMVDLVSCDYS